MGAQREKVLPTWSATRILAVLGLIGSVAACGDRPDAELGWARAALERNPQLEVLAVDAPTKMITVRNKATGQVRTVAASDIAAAPIIDLATNKIERPLPPPEQESLAASEEEPALDKNTEALADEAPAAAPTFVQRDVRIERENGRVRVSGAGVSIVTADPATSRTTQPQTQRERDLPIICEGKRFMQLDSRDLEVDGTAIEARDGCELYVTNSRISATGTAIVARNATVHISNSQISGVSASLEALDNAKFYLRSSTFRGASRRDDRAAVQDLGGNEWR